MTEKFKRKNNRLDISDYEKHHAYFLTLSCKNEQKAFIHRERVEEYVTVLRETANEFDMNVHAYCFMPDHLHLLVEGEELIDYVRKFKQITGYRFRQNTDRKLWQKSYYDHVLRDEESIRDVAYYIFNNPVRADLVENFTDYPYSGSFEFDWNNMTNMEH